MTYLKRSTVKRDEVMVVRGELEAKGSELRSDGVSERLEDGDEV